MVKQDTAALPEQIEASLWDFALKLYSQPGIETESLRLQDQYNANINIILWCCWLEAENVSLPIHRMDDVLITIDAVSLQTVVKLREVRQALLTSGGFTRVQAQRIKQHILNAELIIEKVLLQRLQDLTRGFLDARDYRENSRRIDLQYYLDFIGVPNAQEDAARILEQCNSCALDMAE